jgi:hypothetical protein
MVRIVALFVTAAMAVLGAQGTESLPLLHASDLAYGGAFRLPQGRGDMESFEYGGRAMAFDSSHESIYMVGHDWHQRIAELTVPEIRRGASLDELATASFRQPFTDVKGNALERVGSGSAIGGLLVSDGTLVVSAYVTYDGNGAQKSSHFRRSADLSRAEPLEGPFQLANVRAGFVGGYMTPVPPEWQRALGGPALTGLCCISIISRTSLGPTATVFDPAHLAGTAPVPATQLVGYPITQPALGRCESTNNTFNCATLIGGLVFPNRTRSVLFFGRQGIGEYCYGEGGRTPPAGGCVDPTDSAKGTHAYPYAYQVWAYDALDLAAVKNGRKKPFEVKPYETWTFDLPFGSESRVIRAVAFDPVMRRIFVAAAFSDRTRPLVHVFDVKSR